MNAVVSFFSTVVVIDDELPALGSTKLPPGSKWKIPVEAVRSLIGENMIVTPFPYKAGARGQALELIKRAKLNVLDWHLVKQDSSAAKGLIREVVQTNGDTLKWIVVYSTTDVWDMLDDLLGDLSKLWANNEDLSKALAVARQARTDQQELAVLSPTIRLQGVFVTFMNKSVRGPAVVTALEEVIRREFGPMALAFLRLATDMERSSFRVLQELAHPFDLSVHLHAHSNKIGEDDIPGLLFTLYADSHREFPSASVVTTVTTELRKERFETVKAANKLLIKRVDDLKVLLECLGGKLDVWQTKLPILAGCDQDRLMEKLNAEKSEVRFEFEAICAFSRWLEKHPKGTAPQFMLALAEQAERFTRVLKYRLDSTEGKIRPGSIFYDEVKNEYYLCITPACDAVRPTEKVEDHFKFLVGRETQATVPATKVSQHATYVPHNGRLVHVVWSYFRTKTLDLAPPKAAVQKLQADDPFDQWVVRGCNLTELAEIGADWNNSILKSPGICAAVMEHTASAEGPVAKQLENLLSVLARNVQQFESEVRASRESIRKDPVRWLQELVEAKLIKEGMVITKDREFFTTLKPVGQLKREYAQQIINEYGAYQERVGVHEVYFKETATLAERIGIRGNNQAYWRIMEEFNVPPATAKQLHERGVPENPDLASSTGISGWLVGRRSIHRDAKWKTAVELLCEYLNQRGHRDFNLDSAYFDIIADAVNDGRCTMANGKETMRVAADNGNVGKRVAEFVNIEGIILIANQLSTQAQERAALVDATARSFGPKVPRELVEQAVDTVLERAKSQDNAS